MNARSLTVAAFLAASVSAGAAYAQNDEDVTIQQILDLPIKFAQAMTIATDNAEGQLLELTLDEFEGQPVYLAALAGPASISELMISGEDGSVIGSRVQTAADAETLEMLLDHEEAEMEEVLDMLDELPELAVMAHFAELEDMHCGPETVEH